MGPTEFDEPDFFRAIAASGVRALLIGRRALVALGLPVLSADYDFWLHREDIERFNQAVESFGLVPGRSPDEARSAGRYLLENDERVDVLVASAVTTVDGEVVRFEVLWAGRQQVETAPGVLTALPSLDGLIATKRFAARSKDAEDIRLLEVLRKAKGA